MLLLGEPGLGKASLAAHIHYAEDAACELPLIQIGACFSTRLVALMCGCSVGLWM